MTEQNEMSIADQVSLQIEVLRAEAETKFAQGYQSGRAAQAAEDRYYIERVGELSKLLAAAEEEIRRLRANAGA
jgi:hypothetical protein